jgi:hypothetical protein
MNQSSTRVIQLLRWTARITSLFGLFIWGAFFVEHLTWFFQPQTDPPTMWVWLGQGMHLVLLAGYLLAWWRERTGSLLILVGAVGFFMLTGGENMLLFILVSILPALLYLGGWLVKSRS